MTTPIIRKDFSLPECSEKEILRYIGWNGDSENFSEEILSECIAECQAVISPMVCYGIFPVKTDENTVCIDPFSFHSKLLARNLKNASQVVLFAATLGIGIDRLIAKHSRISPSKALLFQGIGSERVEALCDVFCNSFKENCTVFPRFSPGYGDLSLETQKDVFALLECTKHLGISLGESLLMTPTKSVTAFMGIL